MLFTNTQSKIVDIKDMLFSTWTRINHITYCPMETLTIIVHIKHKFALFAEVSNEFILKYSSKGYRDFDRLYDSKLIYADLRKEDYLIVVDANLL